MLFGLSRREYSYAGGAAIVKSQCQLDKRQGKGIRRDVKRYGAEVLP
jgi:hypothetical protein